MQSAIVLPLDCSQQSAQLLIRVLMCFNSMSTIYFDAIIPTIKSILTYLRSQIATFICFEVKMSEKRQFKVS